MLKYILVEEQMFDEVAFQSRFVSSAARRLISGHEACNAAIVRPYLPNSHPLRFQSSGCGLSQRHSGLHSAPEI